MSDDMVKVKDIIAILEQFDPELPVLLQKDPEGNGFFWARGADDDAWVDKGDLASDRTEDVREAADITNDEDEVDPDFAQCVVIFP